MTVLFWLAILPSILLARNVLSYDKIEKEPAGLLIKLFLLGMLSCVPAGIIENIGSVPIESFADNRLMYSMLTYLILVPAAEECSKFVMLRTTWKNQNFNYTFDGIVYGVIVSLGFATLENILYVMLDGTFTIAIVRGVLSVPLHCTCGVFMGYYYGVAKGLEVQGLRDRASFARKLAIAVPWVIHGLYDFAVDSDSVLVLILGLFMTVVVFIIAARQVRFASKHDTPIYPNIALPDPAHITVHRIRDWSSKGTRPPSPTKW